MEELKSLLRNTDENIKKRNLQQNHYAVSVSITFIFWGFCGMFAAIAVLAVALLFCETAGL